MGKNCYFRIAPVSLLESIAIITLVLVWDPLLLVEINGDAGNVVGSQLGSFALTNSSNFSLLFVVNSWLIRLTNSFCICLHEIKDSKFSKFILDPRSDSKTRRYYFWEFLKRAHYFFFLVNPVFLVSLSLLEKKGGFLLVSTLKMVKISSLYSLTHFP